VSDGGAARRRAHRRAQVRRTALLLAVLGLAALAFAVWFAVDAPDTTAVGLAGRSTTDG